MNKRTLVALAFVAVPLWPRDAAAYWEQGEILVPCERGSPAGACLMKTDVGGWSEGDGVARYYVDYFCNNLFDGLACHRFGCVTDGSTVMSDRTYQGFSAASYCHANTPIGNIIVDDGHAWLDSEYLGDGTSLSAAEARLDSCGSSTNATYGIATYGASSTTCDYSILANCNSDCWIRQFSTCMGHPIGITSPCW